MNIYQILTILFTLYLNINAQKKCCETCKNKKNKYYSVPKLQNYNCGESCLLDSDYLKYKLFEPELQKATSNNPCKDLGYLRYLNTENHSIGKLNVNVDLYTKKNLKNINNDNICLAK